MSHITIELSPFYNERFGESVEYIATTDELPGQEFYGNTDAEAHKQCTDALRIARSHQRKNS